MANSSSFFNSNVWGPALEKFGAVTHLTVIVYDENEQVVCTPVPPSPFFKLFSQYMFLPDILTQCAKQCLAQKEDRPAVIVASSTGLAVVGTSLILEGRIVGAAVAGFALVEFAQSLGISRLARQSGIPYNRLWELAREQHPVPQRRLTLHGELLQVLGDTILQENYRTRQLEESAGRLEQEMSAKDQFLAILSHELRTPLTPILGWVALLRKVGENPSHRQKAADSIERNALLEIKLVDDLLDLNRIMRHNIQLDLAVHDVTELLHSALDTIADTVASKKIQIDFTAPKEPLFIEADPGRLQQVFVNILSNAVKFTPTNGHIRVEAETKDNDAVVRITDTGEGIDPHFLPKVFDIFRQQEEGTRRLHSGLGIGLAVVKQLVTLHGGRVGINSGGPGQGTVVTVHFPITAQLNGTNDPGLVTNQSDVPFRGLTILVIEDTDDSRDIIRYLLETLGAEVLTARDGLEGLEVLANAQPDIVLCDLRMPRMDGFEFLQEIRSQGREHFPVLALTGLVSEADRQRTKAAGFAGHLNKPFNDAALIEVVQSTLLRRRTA